MTARDRQSSIACDRHGQCIPRHYMRLELSLREFLSLTVEMLRHKCYSNRSKFLIVRDTEVCLVVFVVSLVPRLHSPAFYRTVFTVAQFDKKLERGVWERG